MPNRPLVLVLAWVPDGALSRLAAAFPTLEFIDGRDPALRDRHLARAAITYGPLSPDQLGKAEQLRWVQLSSAGVPPALCQAAIPRGLTITNLAGLYGPAIAEHALALMTILAQSPPGATESASGALGPFHRPDHAQLARANVGHYRPG